MLKAKASVLTKHQFSELYDKINKDPTSVLRRRTLIMFSKNAENKRKKAL